MAKINKNAGNKNVKTPTNLKTGAHLQPIASPKGIIGGPKGAI